jgi:hypothetical protein
VTAADPGVADEGASVDSTAAADVTGAGCSDVVVPVLSIHAATGAYEHLGVG